MAGERSGRVDDGGCCAGHLLRMHYPSPRSTSCSTPRPCQQPAHRGLVLADVACGMREPGRHGGRKHQGRCELQMVAPAAAMHRTPLQRYAL